MSDLSGCRQSLIPLSCAEFGEAFGPEERQGGLGGHAIGLIECPNRGSKRKEMEQKGKGTQMFEGSKGGRGQETCLAQTLHGKQSIVSARVNLTRECSEGQLWSHFPFLWGFSHFDSYYHHRHFRIFFFFRIPLSSGVALILGPQTTCIQVPWRAG